MAHRQGNEGDGAPEGRQGGRPGSTSGRPRAGRDLRRQQDPVAISVDHAELKQRIYAGRFLTTIYELDVDGTKHRVIPRDFQLDPVKDLPLHVDFLRLGAGAKIRVRIPVHVLNAEQSPGVKRGGTVNIVTHAIEVICSPEDIPESIDVDISGLEINYSKHLSDVDPAAEREGGGQCRPDAGHHRAAVGLRRRNEGGCRGGCCCRRGCRGCGRSRDAGGRRTWRAWCRAWRGSGRRSCSGRARCRRRRQEVSRPRACHRPLLLRAMTHPPVAGVAACGA